MGAKDQRMPTKPIIWHVNKKL